MSEEHRTLVERASRGEQPAIDDLLTRHLPKLEGFVRARKHLLVPGKESVADVVQSVCREVLENLAQGLEYRGEGQFVSWLHKVALRWLLHKYRHYHVEQRDVGRERPIQQTDGDGDPVSLGVVYATLASPSQEAMARETEGRISEAFDKLTNEYQQVIFLARVLGLSHEEIGEQMDRSPEASRALLYRALGQLSVLIGLDVSGQT